MTLAVGVDVGGSKIAACSFDIGSGRVVRSLRTPTDRARGGAAVLDDCVTAVAELIEPHEVAPAKVPVGIALCELVGPDGAITSAASFDWRTLDVARAFGAHRVVVESDVRAAALAEARLGAGVGRRAFVYVTVGTGISFALVLDGRPYRGAHGNAMILGVPPVEATASGPALARAAGAATAEAALAKPPATTIVEYAATSLGRAMAWLVNALDPEILVVGGGLGLRADYRDAATQAMRTHVEADASRGIAVVPAALGPDAGCIGAALLAADRHPA